MQVKQGEQSAAAAKQARTCNSCCPTITACISAAGEVNGILPVVCWPIVCMVGSLVAALAAVLAATTCIITACHDAALYCQQSSLVSFTSAEAKHSLLCTEHTFEQHRHTFSEGWI
jgi:hypothetical protein